MFREDFSSRVEVVVEQMVELGLKNIVFRKETSIKNLHSFIFENENQKVQNKSILKGVLKETLKL